MKTRLFLLCTLVSATLAADLPYAGKWKVNLAKSDFGQTTVTYESLPGGEWQTTAFGVTYKFKMDVKDYPDGMDGTTVYQRVSGGPGLGGKWQTKKVSGAAGVIEIAQSGTDGLSFKDSDMGMTCDSKLDGKDYPCTGPMMPPGFTIAMKNAPPRSLDITVKKDGKPFFKATYTVAADGKSMAETGGAVASTEKFKITFDRM